MSKSNKAIKKYLGYKFYKVEEDESVTMLRLEEICEFNDRVIMRDLDSGKTIEMNYYTLKDYTPLTPTGFMMFNIVGMKDENGDITKDVVITIYRLLDVQLDINEPYAICRQSCTDFFYTLINMEEINPYVGVCATRDNCPPSIDYAILASCDELYESKMVNFYLDDTIESILFFDTEKYDNVLNGLFVEHMKAKNGFFINDPSVTYNDGWCRNLHTLLRINNVITDLDSMRNITALDCDMFEFLDEQAEGVYSFKPIMLDFFNYIFKLNAVKTMVVEFGFDINFDDFKNSNYTLLRDKNNTLFLVVYTIDGTYLEKDIEEEINKLGVSDKLRISFYNKFA